MTKQFEAISSDAMNQVAGGTDYGQTVDAAATAGLNAGLGGALAHALFPRGRSRLHAAARGFGFWAPIGIVAGAGYDLYTQSHK